MSHGVGTAGEERVTEAIGAVLPTTIDEQYLAETFGAATYEYDTEAVQRSLSDPVWELLDRGGKRWRATVFRTLVEGFRADPEPYAPYAAVPELLHTGTLLVDDVEDGASMRRGEPAIHEQYGVDIALNAGNALYFLPMTILRRNPGDVDGDTRLAAYEMIIDELNRAHLGQSLDIHWHNEREIRIDEARYLEMCSCKTGSLGRLAARLAAILTEQPPAAERAVSNWARDLSLAFQISDDVLDIESTRGAVEGFGKEAGNDIREGKKTLLVIHAAEHAPPEDVARLEAILDAGDTDRREIEECIDILDESGSIDYARQRARELKNRALDHLDAVDLDADAARELAAFTEFAVEREV
ncbi:geranylgeranyl diphosphate synthase, type I [Natronoarchaeum philippinense]|uniref:Geranylgeranyl diphosphate synthase, type I n=1 Tax=Natronoarchaeum philippinense TaxID=558529 RepID=A0A285NZW9_NATPI|nr:polyprenyl synthetase family protein [Natronoarchaeum philippinense]SNZ14999.1 geranylgeranyl diphosphate synthase, type I [Natronoarchaeum philippinense]